MARVGCVPWLWLVRIAWLAALVIGVQWSRAREGATKGGASAEPVVWAGEFAIVALPKPPRGISRDDLTKSNFCEHRPSVLEPVSRTDSEPAARAVAFVQRKALDRVLRFNDVALCLTPEVAPCEKPQAGAVLHELEQSARFIGHSGLALGEGYVLSVAHGFGNPATFELVGDYLETLDPVGRTIDVSIPQDSRCASHVVVAGDSRRGEDWRLYYAPDCPFLPEAPIRFQPTVPPADRPLVSLGHPFGVRLTRSTGRALDLRRAGADYAPLLATTLEAYNGSSGSAVWFEGAVVGLIQAGQPAGCATCGRSCWAPKSTEIFVEPIATFLESNALGCWCEQTRRSGDHTPSLCRDTSCREEG